ncbi:MAG: hypothetical protein QOK26_3876, partial [Pseudonocardiales bacterium]|nr:hypothetical protein [Pseudonocardiales bacterium]
VALPDAPEPDAPEPGGPAVGGPEGGAPALELVAASPSALLDAGVTPWAGPRRTLGEVLRGIASAVGASSPDAPQPDAPQPGGSEPGGSAVGGPGGGAPALELVAASPSALLDAGVTPWAGPRSLPLWLPPTHHGFLSRDTSPALAAGLAARPLAASASDALAYERSLGLDRPRLAGLSATDETDLLTRLT